MDALTLLKKDHQAVERLFKRFEKAGPRAHVEKRQVVDRIIEELSIHAAIEEQLFYPVTRATVPETEDIALESLEEHHVVKWLLSELTTLPPEDERFDAKVTVLMENVRHHVKEEEQEFFPMVRKELSRSVLGELGDAMAEARSTAPTRPHPKSPDAPPLNLVTGLVAGVTDRVGDTVSGIAQGGVAATRDLIARITGTARVVPSPTGSRVTRRQATNARRNAASAADTVVDLANQALREGQELAGAATENAKRSVGSARRS